MTAAEARTYIANFHHVMGKKKPFAWVQMANGKKIFLKSMTDDDAIFIAGELQSWELEAAANVKKEIN